jgi:hypothetical protein
VTTEPIDDSYPESWKPSYVRDRDAVPSATETWLASLSDDEFTALTKKVRGDR